MFGKKTLTIKKQKVHSLKNPFDFENDPAYISAMEKARKILKETPLPDAIIKRLAKPE